MILNLTQHNATEDQISCGVVEPTPGDKELIGALLTFGEIPSTSQIMDRVTCLVEIAVSYAADGAMIGGAPYLMEFLAPALRMARVRVLYSFTKRVVAEKMLEDGSVEKVSVFKHVGFVDTNQQ